jgi:hypothetical protein
MDDSCLPSINFSIFTFAIILSFSIGGVEGDATRLTSSVSRFAKRSKVDCRRGLAVLWISECNSLVGSVIACE